MNKIKGKSKRYSQAVQMVDKNKEYTINEAVDVLKKMPRTKFDESLNVSCKIGIDLKELEQGVRSSVVLPHGIGKTVKVLVFCDPEKETEAKEAGADYIGTMDLADKILKEGWMDFDCCIATPGMMKVVSKLGKVLGPRGLMPSPKTGTVTDNVAFAIKEARLGKIDFRMDKFGCIHTMIGKISFSSEALIANAKVFLDALIAAKPSSAGPDFIRSIYFSTSMSPSVRIKL